METLALKQIPKIFYICLNEILLTFKGKFSKDESKFDAGIKWPIFSDSFISSI